MSEEEKYNAYIYAIYHDPDFLKEKNNSLYNPESYSEITTSKMNGYYDKTVVNADDIGSCYISVECNKCKYRFFVLVEVEAVGSEMRQMGYEICYSGDISEIICPVCGQIDDTSQQIEFYAYPQWDIQYYGEDSFRSEKFSLTYIPREIFDFDFGESFRAYYFESEYNLYKGGGFFYEIVGRCYCSRKNLKSLIITLDLLEKIDQLDFIDSKIDLDFDSLKEEIKSIITHEQKAFNLEFEKFLETFQAFDPEEGSESELEKLLITANHVFLMDELGAIKSQFISVKEKFISDYFELIYHRKLKKLLIQGTSKYMRYVIFLSYYHEDRPTAEKIKDALESQTDYPEIEIEVWYDQENFFTGDPMTKVPQAIWQDTEGFIALISEKGLIESKYVRDELRNGYQKYIVQENWNFFPIKLGDFSDGLIPLYIRTTKYLPYEASEGFFKKLIRDICVKFKME